MAITKFPLYLIGMPGSGKTGVGQLLSDTLDLAFIDLDHYIETEQNMSIKDIFETFGEAHFRQLETKYLKMFQHFQGVISTGGGIILNPQHIDMMKQGYVIFLDTPVEVLKKRLSHDQHRPSHIITSIDALYEIRMPLYQSCCDIKIDNIKTIKDVVKEIINHLEDKNGNTHYTWS